MYNLGIKTKPKILCLVLVEMEGILPSGVMESFAGEVEGWLVYQGNLPLIACGVSLARHGLLRSLEEMTLGDQNDDVVDLNSVPAEHLASLVSSVTKWVGISNVVGCDLVTILDSVKSQELHIWHQSLGSEETQALVQAMESRVEKVKLWREVTLNIRILMDYNGQGKCWELECVCDTADKHKGQLRTWAMSRNWTVTHDNTSFFIIRKL